MLRGRNPNESPGIIQSVVESCRWNSSETYDIWDMVHGIWYMAVKPQEPQDEISPAFSTVHFNDQFSFRRTSGSSHPTPSLTNQVLKFSSR